MAHIQIPPNARVFMGGMTGSGKTFLAKYLLRPDGGVRRLVVMNVKDDPDLIRDLQLEPETTRNWRKLAQGKPMRISVSHPIGDPNLYNYYAAAFRKAFMAANTVVYVDELLSVIKNYQTFPTYLGELYTRGRQAIDHGEGIVSGNMGTFACSQRPRGIPGNILINTEHFFVFRNPNPDDRDWLAKHTHPMIAEPIPDSDKHGFWYFDRDHMTEPIYTPELRKE